jgi:L-ribulose-5-phosphate 3-epimerase
MFELRRPLHMLLAYNTNGLAHHDLLDAIAVLSEIGYRGVAITLDHGSLNPYDDRLNSQLESVVAALAEHEMRCVIETGARFLLNPRTKHEPTLITTDPAQRARRVDFLCRATDIAARLNATCVSLWSGVVRDGAGDREAFDRLAEGLAKVIEHTAARDIPLAFEPEPGMLVDTVQCYDDLLGVLQTHHINAAPLGLTLDIGHLHCQGELPIEAKIEQYADRLATVHIEDMRAGIHEHLMFGEGEIDFRPVITALARIGYAGVVGVELSRHSHEGPQAARKAYDFLQPLIESATAGST